MTLRSRRLISLPLAVLAAAAIANPALAGSDGDEEFVPTPVPSFVQPVEAPPSVAAPEAPAPEAPAPPAVPVDTVLSQPVQAHKAPTEHKAHTKAAKRQTVNHRTKTVVARTKAKAVVTPVGGVQAGAGGTSTEPSDAPIGAVLLGGFALALLGGARAFARN